MDWAKYRKRSRNLIISINGSKGIAILTNTEKPGRKLILDASKTYDSDGDNLTFKWWVMSEAGTFTEDIKIEDSNTNKALLVGTTNAYGKLFQVICEVTDNGAHNLSSYRRIVFEPTNK
ncbi:hypothetical protein GCM10028808_57020 [Spirosoma migulaei]